MTMTTRPTSHLIHSGFLDILSLIPESTQSQAHVQAQVQIQGKKKTEDDLRQILRDHGQSRVPPRTPRKGKEREKKSMEVGLRKRKVDKEMIGPPMDFRYVSFTYFIRELIIDMYSMLLLMRKLLNYY